MALIRALGRLGVTLGRRGAWARMRFLALTATSAVLVIAISALVLVNCLHNQRQQRGDVIRPSLTTQAQARLLVSYDGFTELGEHGVLVMSIWPLSADAPLPPGVSRWPQPGQAVVSPAVAADLRRIRPDLFGTVVGEIGLEGLEEPAERRVYLRPSQQAFDPASFRPASGFGGTGAGDGWYGLSVLNSSRSWEINAMLLLAAVLPALVALALAGGLDGEARAARMRMLTIVGAGRRHLALVDASEAWIPVTAGTLLGAGLVALLAVFGLRLGNLDTVIDGADVRGFWPLLLLAVLAAHLLAIVTVLVVRQRPSQWRRHRPRFGQAPPVGRATVCVIACLATIWLPGVGQLEAFRTIAYAGGSLVVAMTIPALLGVLLAGAGVAVARWGTWRGSAASIIGGRRLELFPVRTTRLALGVCGSILILGQVQLWTSQLGHQYTQALSARQQFGTVTLTAQHSSYEPSMQRYLETLPPDALPIWIWRTPVSVPGTNDVLTISGSCRAMKALNVACTRADADLAMSTSRATTSLLASGALTQTVHVIPAEQANFQTLAKAGAQLSLVSASDRNLPLADLQQRAYELLPGGLQLGSIGQDWVSAGALVKIRSGWAEVWGLLGALAVTVAAGFAMAGDVIAAAKEIAPLAAVAGRRRWIYTLAGWRLGLPLTLAGVLGAAVYFILPSGIEGGEVFMTPSLTFAVTGAGCAIVAAAALVGWSGRIISARAGDWRPGQE